MGLWLRLGGRIDHLWGKKLGMQRVRKTLIGRSMLVGVWK